MNQITCRGVSFYSEEDENGFFARIKAIKSVKNFKGQGLDLNFTLQEKITEEDILELIAIFKRYRIVNILKVNDYFGHVVITKKDLITDVPPLEFKIENH